MHSGKSESLGKGIIQEINIWDVSRMALTKYIIILDLESLDSRKLSRG
jgi:hypothetical protein